MRSRLAYLNAIAEICRRHNAARRHLRAHRLGEVRGGLLETNTHLECAAHQFEMARFYLRWAKEERHELAA